MSNTSTPWIKIVLAATGGAALALGVAYFGFWKPEHTRKVEQIAQLDTSVKDLTETKAKLETTVKAETEKSTQLTTTVNDQNTKLTEIRTRVGDLEKNITDLSTQKASTEKEKAEIESKLATASKALDAARVELAEMVKQNGALKGQVADLENRLDLAEARVVAISKELENTTVALKKEQAARVEAEKAAHDTHLQQLAAMQQNAEMQRMYAQLTPTRLEQRNETLVGRKLAQKKGVPLGFIFDGIGDAFQGTGEAIGGKSGPKYWVAVMPDKTEVRITDEIATAWQGKGVPVASAEK
jgi:predicted  nucleic acid-binding Zn-ribbon protein